MTREVSGQYKSRPYNRRLLRHPSRTDNDEEPAHPRSLLLSRPGLSQAQGVKGDAKAGEGKIAMCIGCHGIPGYQASFPEVYKVPMISGQNAQFIVAALNAYRKGERKHPTMRGIAESLTDQDIADIAAFYAQHGKSGEAPPEQPEQPPAHVAQLLQKGACASCHGANFNKPIDGSYPKIAGQHRRLPVLRAEGVPDRAEPERRPRQRRSWRRRSSSSAPPT